MPNIELGMGQIIFIKLALKILKLDVQILKLIVFSTHLSSMGKKEYVNASILQIHVVFLLLRVFINGM